MNKMRNLIDIAESLAINHRELDAPDVTGVLSFSELAELFKTDNPLIFSLAMRKILSNRSEMLNDFEILEVTKAFINFVGMSTEEGMRIAMRLGHITKAHHEGIPSPTELDDSDFEQELEAELEEPAPEPEIAPENPEEEPKL